MRNGLASAAVLVAATVVVPDDAKANNQVERGTCSIEIDDYSFNSTPCVVTRSWNEIEFVWQGTGTRMHRGNILLGGGAGPLGGWDGIEGDSSLMLGVLEQDGECWRGDYPRSMICLNVGADLGDEQDAASVKSEMLIDENGELLTPFFGVSAQQCAMFYEWMREGQKFERQGHFAEDKDAFVEARLTATDLEHRYRGARALTRQVWSCYIEAFVKGDEFPLELTLSLVGGYRAQFERHPVFEEVLRLWRNDLMELADIVETIEDDDPRYEPLIGVARMISTQWRFMPFEIANQDEHSALNQAVNAREEARKNRAIEARKASEQAALENFMQAAVDAHGAAVDQMGFDPAFLNSQIVLEGMFGNNRWITLRDWIAALYHTGQFESIEGSQLNGLNAYGIVTKRPAQRSRAWYFQREGNELFLTYVGDGAGVYPVFDHERVQLNIAIQDMIR